MKKALLIGFLLCFAMLSYSEIVVQESDNGKIIISNKSIQTYTSKMKKLGFLIPGKKATIPYQYLSKIDRLSRKYQLRKDLIVAVAKAESDFNPYAVSKKGAVGLMQLMWDTARMYGVTNRYDVDQNLDAGTRHLKYLHKKYDGDLPLTLAAYNAGEEAVKKYKGVPPYKETRTYVKRVMKYMGLRYRSSFKTSRKARIYKLTSKDGKIIITDTLPSKIDGKVEVIN
jgi:soluble lytic murein transglycosylase-like protein